MLSLLFCGRLAVFRGLSFDWSRAYQINTHLAKQPYLLFVDFETSTILSRPLLFHDEEF